MPRRPIRSALQSAAFAAVLIVLVPASDALAQGAPGFHLGLSGGAMIPVQDQSDVYNVGWNAMLLIPINFGASPFGIRLDGAYSESLTLTQARRRDVLVAYELEGEPLSSEHGGPVRLYVAPMYGYKSLKWLSTIEVTRTVEEGYWEVRGYDVDAWVGRSNGRDDDAT